MSDFISTIFGGMLSLTGILVAVTGIFIAEYRGLQARGAGYIALSRYKKLAYAGASLTAASALVTLLLLLSLTLGTFDMLPATATVVVMAALTASVIIGSILVVVIAVLRLD